MSTSDGYAVVDMPGSESNWQPGEPRLPVIICHLLIPAGAAATGIQVTSEKREAVDGSYLVYPVQTPGPASLERTGFTPPFAEVYDSDSTYPGTLARLVGTGDKAGFSIAEILIYPVQYRPGARTLEVCTDLSIEVEYKDGPRPMLSNQQYSWAASELERLAANPGDIARFAPSRRASLPQDCEYVVITSRPIASSFTPLLDWYRQTGLTADVKTTDWIYASYPGVDHPEQIRNFIIDYFDNHGLTYVLLAGDTQIVPCRKGRATAPPYTDDIPADLYYSDLQWSWNGNHDTVWGEYGVDTVDFYADVEVGRAPVDDSAQAAGFVGKLLGYEFNPAPGYARKILLPYTALYSNYPANLSQDTIANFVPRGWQVSLFTGMSDVNPIHDSIESGFGLAHVVAHGNNVGMYTMSAVPIYSTTAAASQTNARKLPVLTSIACYAGNFEYNDCLAEVLMNNPNGGAVATIMNSRYGIAQPPGMGPAERLDLRFYDFLFRSDSCEIGAAHCADKDYYAPIASASGGIWQWSLYELNLFGDPRMPIWTDEPQPLAAEYPHILNTGAQQLTIRVTRNTLPVAGAEVHASKNGDFAAQGITGPDGVVTLSIAPQTEGRFDVVALARNGIPCRDSGMVRNAGPYVIPCRHTLSDSAPGGNQDGIVNPGETIKMSAWFRNYGNQPASDVIAIMRTADPNLTISDSTATLGSIPAGDSVMATGFTFTVAGACTNGYVGMLSLAASDDQDSTWISPVAILVGTSLAGFESCQVVDTLPGGNGNYRLDPGETARLVITLFNSGFGNAYSVHGLLRSTDPRLVILDSSGAFGSIPAETSGTNCADPYIVRADSGITPGASIACSLVITTLGEPARTCRFDLPIGQLGIHDPVPDTGGSEHRYYAYDDTDTGYAWHPTYQWIEARYRGDNLHLSNDSTTHLRLPFNFRYYGQAATELSVCSNGWVASGITSARNWTNRRLPDGNQPYNMICTNWDNLDPSLSGAVWWLYDTSANCLVIEWDSVAYHDTSSVTENFEIVIYDSTHRTPTNDNEIVFQYQTANYYGSSTIGIQNSNSTVGICYLFDSSYNVAAAPILPGRAIKFTTYAPDAAVWEQPTVQDLQGTKLEVLPSIGRHFLISVPSSLSRTPGWQLVIFDPAGRRVRDLAGGTASPLAGAAIPWDGSNDLGRRVVSGPYFCIFRAPGLRAAACRLLIIR